MTKTYLNAAIAEQFFSDLASLFDQCRDQIDPLKISDDDGRYYQLLAIFYDNDAVNFDKKHNTLLHQLALLLSNTTSLYAPFSDDDEDYFSHQLGLDLKGDHEFSM